MTYIVPLIRNYRNIKTENEPLVDIGKTYFNVHI